MLNNEVYNLFILIYLTMVKVAWLRITNNKGFDSGIAKNSTVIANNDLLKSTQGTGVEVAGAGDTIVGISACAFTADSDNFTVDKKRAIYTPTDALDEVLLSITGGTITAADEDKFYDLGALGVDGTTESTTTGQVRMSKFISATQARFQIVNA